MRPASPSAARQGGRQGVGTSASHDVIVRLVRAIPQAVKILVGVLAAIALLFGLGMLAVIHSRRRLARQRTALLDDVDLLQRALLPAPAPTVGPVAVSAAFAPAEGLAAGGDFYDIFQLEDGRVAAFLGDICGHGRVAVEKAALARFTLRTLLSRGGSLADAFAEADRLLAHDLDGLFATVIAVRLSADGRHAETVSAGHEPPIRLGGDDPPLDTGPALGFNLGLSGWPEAGFDLAAEETLVLFSDGLVEARLPDGALVGRDRLAGIVAEARSAEQVIARLRELSAVDDDLACLTISRRKTV